MWLSRLEQVTTSRLTRGERWRMTENERAVIVEAWRAESRPGSRRAVAAVKRLTAEYRGLDLQHPRCCAFADVAATESPRWDVWDASLARADAGDPDGDVAASIALVERTLAVAARRNPQLQQVADQLQLVWLRTGHQPDAQQVRHEPMDAGRADRLRIATNCLACCHTTRHAGSVTDSYPLRLSLVGRTLRELITEQPDTWRKTVTTTRSRIDQELRRPGGLKDGDTWIPLSPAAVERHNSKGLSDAPSQTQPSVTEQGGRKNETGQKKG